jgi:hypothetical protein
MWIEKKTEIAMTTRRRRGELTRVAVTVDIQSALLCKIREGRHICAALASCMLY